MPRLTPQSYKTLIKSFELDGFSVARFEGRHYIMNKTDVLRPLVIPKYDEVGIDIITANLRSAGMSRKKYFELLSQVK